MPSIRELREVCQKASNAPSLASQTLYGRLNRVWSIYLTWIFIRLPFTPNQITTFGTIVFLVGACMFLFHERWANVTGVFLFMLSYALDAVDGELARWRKQPSKFDMGGVYVEPVSHDVQYGWMFLPIALGVYFETGSPWAFVAGFAATSGKLLFRLLEFRFMSFRRYSDEVRGTVYGWVTKQATPKSISYAVFRNLFVTTGMIPWLLLASFLNRVDVWLYFYGIGLFALYIALFLRNAKRVMDLSKKAQAVGASKPLFRPKAVVFDFDGTLVDTMQKYGDIAADVMVEYFGSDRAWARQKYFETSGVPFIQQLGTLFPGDAKAKDASEAFEHRKNQYVETYHVPEETRQVVAALRGRGIDVAVSSNNFEASLERFVARAGLSFSHVMGYRDGFRKGEQHLRHMQSRSGAKPEEVLFVGDSLHDAAVALQNGVSFVARVGTFSRATWQEKYPHVVAIEGLSELLALVDAMPAAPPAPDAAQYA